MSKSSEAKPLFVEFHVLRSYPPSNLNRDDLGSPKSIVFGDVRRVRVSSQCLKRTWRTSPVFKDNFTAADLGTRTARLPEKVKPRLPEDYPADAREGLSQIFDALGKKSSAGTKAAGEAEDEAGERDDEGDEDAEKTSHLLFLSQGEIDAVVAFAESQKDELAKLGAAVRQNADDDKRKKAEAKASKDKGATAERDAKPTRAKKPKKAGDEQLKTLRDELKRYLEETAGRSAVDVALFGRFLTSNEFKECDAALQVAHALGTQKLDLEYDYFTAVDDLQPSAETGAGHVGETELCASVLYEYAVCSFPHLVDNLDGERATAANAMGAIAKAMCRSVFEKAKKNGTAPHTPADYLEVVIRRDAPVSLANAFLRPIRAGRDKDVMTASIEALRAQADKYDVAYGADGVERHFLCLRDGVVKDGHKSLAELANAVTEKLSKAV